MKVLAALALIALALVFAGLSYYAFVESKSVPWGAGYAGASLVALVLTFNALTGRSGNDRRD